MTRLLLAFAAAWLLVPLATAQASPGQLVVGFHARTPAAHIDRLTARHARATHPVGATGAYVLDGLRHRADRVTEAMLRDRAVTYVEPVMPVSRAAVTPSPQQWALRNTGQFGGTPGADIDVERAWQAVGYGEGVPVGTIDSGVDFEQPAFAGLDVWRNPGETGTDARGRDKATNRVDDDGNGCVDDVRGCDFVDDTGEPDDKNGHGTSVLSVLAGPASPGPVVGVAPRAKIVAARALDEYASGTTAMEARAIAYLGAQGTRVINVSIAGPDSLAVRNAIAAYPNSLFVVAAGNDGRDDDAPDGAFPCSDPAPNILCVGASTPADTLATFSNFGVLRVDVAAPGERILALKLDGSTGLFRGTSFAAPIVSGIAALMLDARPQATVAQLKDAIKASVEVRPGLAKIRTSGRVNAYNAVQLIRGLTPAPRPSATAPVAPVATAADTTAPVTMDTTTGWTATSALPHAVSVRSAATRAGKRVTLALRCTGAATCDGTVRAVRRGARATHFSLATGRTRKVTIAAALPRRAQRLAVSITVDGIAVRHVVRVKAR